MEDVYYFTFGDEELKEKFEKNLEDMDRLIENFADNFYILGLYSKEKFANKEVAKFVEELEKKGIEREAIIFMLENPLFMIGVFRTEMLKKLSQLLHMFLSNHDLIKSNKMELPSIQDKEEFENEKKILA